MNIRAVLCDIYKTLFEVGPPPFDAERRWTALCRTALPEATPRTLAEFALSAEGVIKRQHTTAKAAGIVHPEVFWPAVAGEAWPALASLNCQTLDDFLFEHAQLQRVVQLMPFAAEVLRSLAEQNLCLGLVSNSQPYTVRELDAALSTVGLSRALFSPDLCFFSFEHGFSKPDPHVFRLLAARLARRGIATGETLVVGDRDDNDISPSRAQGLQTWCIKDGRARSGVGDWRSLFEAFGGA